jgi:hypothetical protein
LGRTGPFHWHSVGWQRFHILLNKTNHSPVLTPGYPAPAKWTWKVNIPARRSALLYGS